ncbi:Ldh family oxidoreductase [Terrarubrum flagellatum]|uniref:Ldh family oxidoreductase n=1 Tax=Terrirubrum flagellatum TaxID=2895980 RepID=UPI003144F03E
MPQMSLDEIETLAFNALVEAGASEAQARPVARSVRRAEADDMRSVGLGYLPLYLQHLHSRKVDGAATPQVSHPRAALVTIDAGRGFAHPAFDAGFEQAVEAARACGVASLAITRSYSIGVLGHPVEDIATRGLVALAFTNSPPNMAAWGGKRKIFGTNPLAFAAPRMGAPPLVVDQSSTVVTKVALVAAAGKEESIPSHWAFDSEGRATTNAAEALKGSMAPFGGVKGANIALLVELLGAALTGANLSMNVHPYAIAEGPPPEVGQHFILFDPDAFAPGFVDRIAMLVEAMTGEGARAPGARRLIARERAAKEGCAVDDALIARIRSATSP